MMPRLLNPTEYPQESPKMDLALSSNRRAFSAASGEQAERPVGLLQSFLGNSLVIVRQARCGTPALMEFGDKPLPQPLPLVRFVKEQFGLLYG